MTEKVPSHTLFGLFKKVILILVLLAIIDRGSGRILKHYYSVQTYGEESQITYIIDSLHTDILIFGSSRANHHYVPEIFESRLHCSCFNAGKDGNYLFYGYALFKSIVRRYNPKLIIFDLRPYELGYIVSEFDRLSLLLPYYEDNPDIQRVVNLRGPFEKEKHLSAIYPYNSLIFQIARGNMGSSKEKDLKLKGYIPLTKTMKYEKIMMDQNKVILDNDKIDLLKDIISTCKSKKIDLVFVYSPVWKITTNNIKTIPDLCRQEGAHYIDLSNDSTFLNNPQYFEDLTHLNDKGARIFTNLLIDKILSEKTKDLTFYNQFQ